MAFQDKLTALSSALATYTAKRLNATEKGATNGVAPLVNNLVPVNNLPGAVDNIDEYANVAAFPAVGVKERIYIDLSAIGVAGASSQYRWSGTAYQPLIKSPGSTDALVEGSSNLYFTTARASNAAPVQSVVGLTGAITAANLKSALGIGIGDVASLSSTLAAKAGTDGTGASGTWGISITGSAASLVSGNGYQLRSLGVNVAAPSEAGYIRASGDIIGFYSDERLKEVVSLVKGASEGLMSFSVIVYKGNETAARYGFETNELQIGLKAQEVLKYVPYVVKPAPFDIAYNEKGQAISKTGKNFLTMKYERMIPYVICGFQEQYNRVTELENKVRELEAKIATL